MRKVLHFDSPRQKYHCDAAVVWCYDNRFEAAFRKLLKRLGVEHPDPIRVAGGAKCFASPDSTEEAEFVLEQIRKSVRLHATGRVILLLHSDCGAYGGLQGAFKGDSRAEAERFAAELARAADFVQSRISAVRVETYFADFEGVWEPTGLETRAGGSC